MNEFKLISGVFETDPIAGYSVTAALVIVGLAIPLRRGSVSARFIINVFAIIATLGTVLKFAAWTAVSRQGPSIAEMKPSGTDWVLAMGGLTAILYTSLQELAIAFAGDPKGKRMISGVVRSVTNYSPGLKRLVLAVQSESTGDSRPVREAMDRGAGGVDHDGGVESE